MNSPSLKTCESDESTEDSNSESDEELYISNYHQQCLIKSITTTEVETLSVGFTENYIANFLIMS